MVARVLNLLRDHLLSPLVLDRILDSRVLELVLVVRMGDSALRHDSLLIPRLLEVVGPLSCLLREHPTLSQSLLGVSVARLL